MLKKILLMCIICLLLSSSAQAAGKVYEISTVAQLQDRMENAQAGDTLRLTKDLTITGQLGTYNQMYVYTDITLDMNGKTLRDERIGGPRVINIRPEGSMSIIGDGRFESMDHNSDFIQALGPLFVYSGYFGHDPFTWGDPNCKYASDDHENNYRKLGYMISSYISPSEGYRGYVTVYNGTFDSGVQNPDKVYEKYKMDTNRNKTCYFMYPLINEGNSRPHGVTTYGGTYVTANPANGEANWCDSPSIKDPYYLKGQTELYVAPNPYTLTETTGSDQRKVYTLDYPVTLTAVKQVKNLTKKEIGLAGFRFELTNQASGKKIKAISDENGEIVFDLPLEDAEDTYTLREIPGNDPRMDYSDAVYEVRIVPGPQEERFKPVAQVYLNGKEVDTAVFSNVYGKVSVPKTGDTHNLALYVALACGSMLMLAVLARRRGWE